MSTYQGASVSPGQLNALAASGKQVEVIDVRTPAEYRAVHIPAAKNRPLEALDPRSIVESRELKGEPLYVICRSGSRAAQACAAFAAAGFGNIVVNVEGGTLAWEKAGLPVVRGKSVLPLDRQMRILIGSLVVLGVVLGFLVSPVFYGLSAFCGFGMIFAGLTDICPLAMAMAKMPWNQSGGESPACQI